MNFSKDIDKEKAQLLEQRRAEREKNNEVRAASERASKVDYDFANRDVIPAAAKSDGVLGRVVSEEEKVVRPEPVKLKKFDKTSDLDDYAKNSNETGMEFAE